jgi:hypothetical protein
MKKTLIALIIVASAVVGAPASVIFSDDFNAYTNGPIVGNYGNATTVISPWVNNSGATPMMLPMGEYYVTSGRAEDIAAFPQALHDQWSLGPLRQVHGRSSGASTAAGAHFTHFTGDAINFNYHGRG